MQALLEGDPRRWTLVEALRLQGQKRGAATFVTFEGGSTCSFAALDRASDACATGLQRLGIGAGDRVIIIAENSLAFLTVFWGVQKRRAILVPVNVELKGELLAHQLRDSAPKAIVTDRDIEDLSALGLSGVSIIRLSRAVETVTDKARTDFEQLCSHVDADAVLSPAPSDICLILYTSGTSGPSKGVLIPQAHAYLFGLLQARALGVSRTDRFFIALPMFHVNALLMSLEVAWSRARRPMSWASSRPPAGSAKFARAERPSRTASASWPNSSCASRKRPATRITSFAA